MVSTVHETLRDMIRDDPTLCGELLARFIDLDPDSIASATGVDPTVRQNVHPSLGADVVVLLRTRAGERIVVVVEVQLAIAEEKDWSWPIYTTALRREHQCPAALLVICPDASVAAWGRRVREVGPRHTFAPLVIGPEETPKIEAAEEARRRPSLAVLSAIAHGNDPDHGVSVVLAALSAVNTLDEEHARVYTGAIWDALDRAAQRALEVAMTEHKLPVETNFERRMRELFEDRWRSESEAKGRAEGEARGRAEGEARGRAEGERDALVTVLSARGFSVDDDVQRRIDACSDVEQLKSWIARAVNAPSIDAVFA